jgi:DeoR/GlpR family transcriptional regulator of sugar metabolism
MAATPQNPPLSGLARALVQAGQLKEAEAEQLLAQAHSASLVNVYLLNGFLNRDSLSVIGVPSEDFLRQMNISKAYCGAAGFTIRDGLTDVDMGFIEQKRVIIKHARQVIGLFDHTKIGVASLASFASIDEIDTIITDRRLPDEMTAELAPHQIVVVVA